MSVIVVSFGFYMSNPKWQSRLSLLARLYQGFFITTKNQGLFWRRQIQINNIPKHLLKKLVIGQLECLSQMWIDVVCRQYPLYACW